MTLTARLAATIAALALRAAPALASPPHPTPSPKAGSHAKAKAYGKYCKFCHNEGGTGNGALAPKDTHPPSLIDATWDHGSTDGEIFANIKDGVGPKFDMKPMKAKMMDTDIWNVVNYLRSLGPKK